MPEPERKPLAKLESKDDRISFRVQPSLRELLTTAAIEEGDDLSTYIRECAIEGHTMKQSRKLLKVTVG
jgi:uncharacterized protein (DUF1778 family)